jgi:hypothetical protein
MRRISHTLAALRLTVVVWLVADFGLLYCQFTENYKRVVTLQFSINTAINYTTGYMLGFI